MSFTAFNSDNLRKTLLLIMWTHCTIVFVLLRVQYNEMHTIICHTNRELFVLPLSLSHTAYMYQHASHFSEESAVIHHTFLIFFKKL